MRVTINWITGLVAVGIALAPLPTAARGFEDISSEKLSVGLEFSSLKKGLDATAAFAGNARLPSTGLYAEDIKNSVGNVKLTEVLTRVSYQVNEHFTPALLLGISGLSFGDLYQINIPALLSTDTTVSYSDSVSPPWRATRSVSRAPVSENASSKTASMT